MIEITKIKIDGFANIVDLELDLSNVTALLATNAYGKSNVLTAIHFGIDFITQSIKIRQNMFGYTPAIPINKHNYMSNFSFQIEFAASTSGREYSARYGYVLRWATKDSPGMVVDEYLDAIIDGKSQKRSRLFSRNDGLIKYRGSETAHLNKTSKIGGYELAVNKLLAFDNLFFNGLLEEINSLEFYFDRSFDTSSSYEVSPLIAKNAVGRLSLDDDSLPHALFMLRKDHSDLFTLIVNTMKDLFPFIVDFKLRVIHINEKSKLNFKIDDDAPFEVANDVYLLVVNTTYFDVPVRFNLMSDGVKRVLCLLTKLCIAKTAGIPVIGIEEPENSIHPGLLRSLIQVLSGFLQDTKIIISSHSPFIVNNIPLTSIYLGMPNAEGLAHFARISRSGAKRINQYALDSEMDSGLFIFSLLGAGDEYDTQLLNKSVERKRHD